MSLNHPAHWLLTLPISHLQAHSWHPQKFCGARSAPSLQIPLLIILDPPLHPKESLPWKTATKLHTYSPPYITTCLYWAVYVYDHAASLRISANADSSTTLKFLASGESIERSIPIEPWQTSALELLLLCYFLYIPKECESWNQDMEC